MSATVISFDPMSRAVVAIRRVVAAGKLAEKVMIMVMVISITYIGHNVGAGWVDLPTSHRSV
jgi:hypothetical protein